MSEPFKINYMRRNISILFTILLEFTIVLSRYIRNTPLKRKNVTKKKAIISYQYKADDIRHSQTGKVKAEVLIL